MKDDRQMRKVRSTVDALSSPLTGKGIRLSGKVVKYLLGLLILAMVSGCTMLPASIRSEGPEPGTVGFYEVTPVEGKVVTDNVTARRMSTPGDRIYVYRVDDDMVVLGEGNTNPEAKVKPFDEVSGGVVITPDGAKRLASYLEKVIAQYDSTDKQNSLYMDFRFLTDGTIEEGQGEEVTTKEKITLRFQYIFNKMALEDEETTLCYLGGRASASPKELTYNEIKILISNLQKK